jgi:hypothetical protein
VQQKNPSPQLHFKIEKMKTADRQKAMIVCTIGTQPVIPAVYGVKAPV